MEIIEKMLKIFYHKSKKMASILKKLFLILLKQEKKI